MTALSHLHSEVERRYTKPPRGSAAQRKQTYFRDLATPKQVPSTPALAHALPTHQAHRAPTHTSALFTF
jgi:hypothetical protein